MRDCLKYFIIVFNKFLLLKFFYEYPFPSPPTSLDRRAPHRRVQQALKHTLLVLPAVEPEAELVKIQLQMNPFYAVICPDNKRRLALYKKLLREKSTACESCAQKGLERSSDVSFQIDILFLICSLMPQKHREKQKN